MYMYMLHYSTLFNTQNLVSLFPPLSLSFLFFPLPSSLTLSLTHWLLEELIHYTNLYMYLSSMLA